MSATEQPEEIRLSEVVSALSYALDITEGQPEGHAVRTCFIGMRLAEEIGLSADERSALFYALLLKDLGCSSNAAKVCYLFAADDQTVKRDLKATDWSSLTQAFQYVARNVVPDGSALRRAFQVVTVAMEGNSNELIQTRCERGAQIAQMLGLPVATADAIRSLDEHWDGRGGPSGLKGVHIPLLARIAGLAQTFEVFFSSVGPLEAFEVAQKRRGRWFEPGLVDVLLSLQSDYRFWDCLASQDVRIFLAEHEPEDRIIMASDDRLDMVARAFAKVVDAKSPWTFNHSEHAADIAGVLALTLSLDPARRRNVVRAALLHDIGKLGVSNRILDKPGRLTDAERAEIARHPAYTHKILSGVASFRDVAELAGSHHERLDGCGYHRGLTGDALSIEARIVKVADIYQALSVDRPYRGKLSWEEVQGIMRPDIGTSICGDVFEALTAYVHGGAITPAQSAQRGYLVA
jgi:HD-GYP domain-containing protein (c-di-GMP phosphodiesterase class II)